MFFIGLFSSVTIISLFGNYWGIVAVLLVAIVLCILFKRKASLVLCAAGIIIGTVSWLLFAESHVANNQLIQGNIYTGTISNKTKPGEYVIRIQGSDYLLKTTQEMAVGSTVKLIADKITFSEKRILSREKYALHGLFTATFDYPLWMFMKGYVGSIQSYSIYTIDSTNEKVSFIHSFRKEASSRIKKVYKGNYGGLLEGMLFGGRANLEKSIYTSFIQSGLVHIVAVSGSNISFLVLVFGSILFFIPVYTRIYVIGLIIIFYGAICGLDSSLFRAVTMSLISLYMLVGGKRIAPLRLLRYAITIIIVRNPYMLWYDIGLLLSISCLLGIYGITNLMAHKFPGKRLGFILCNIILSVGAGLGAIPIIYIFMGSISLQGFIANIFVGSLISPIVFFGLLSLLRDKETILSDITTYGLDILFYTSETVGSYSITVNNDNHRILLTFLLCLIVSLLVLLGSTKTIKRRHQLEL